jgi:hypothetical protein
MLYEHAEQPMSRNALEDTDVPALMEIMMVGSSEDICLLDCSLQSPRIHNGPRAAPSWEGGSPSHEDTWHLRSCPEPGADARATRIHDSLGAALSQIVGVIVLT